MKRKWAITILVLVGGAALAFIAHRWAHPLLEFLTHNDKQIAAVMTFIELILIPAPVLVYLVRLWWPEKKEGYEEGSGASFSVSSPQAGRDVIVAGRDVRMGGADIEARDGGQIVGDMVSGSKYVIYQTPSAPAVTAQALHQLPSPPGDFTGREDELKELMAAI